MSYQAVLLRGDESKPCLNDILWVWRQDDARPLCWSIIKDEFVCVFPWGRWQSLPYLWRRLDYTMRAHNDTDNMWPYAMKSIVEWFSSFFFALAVFSNMDMLLWDGYSWWDCVCWEVVLLPQEFGRKWWTIIWSIWRLFSW